MNQTDRNRFVFVTLFVLVVLVALVGWLVWARDPSQLAGVLGAVVVAAGIGEASAVGKRATFKKEAVGSDK